MHVSRSREVGSMTVFGGGVFRRGAGRGSRAGRRAPLLVSACRGQASRASGPSGVQAGP